MKIYGLQKMTLLDYPGHVACTVFLGGCDFRCPFCHNYELACGKAEAVMDDQELMQFLGKRTGLLDGVAFTGGEPLLAAGLPDLIRAVREKGFRIKLDTNGYHPEKLRRMLEEGLVDYVAMDIKNSPGKYALTCGIRDAGRLDISRITESIRLLMSSPTDYEFRTTVVRELHEAADFEEIGQMISGAKRYFLQCFTDRDTVPYKNMTAPEPEQMERFAGIARRYVPDTQLRGM
ncbi:MAG: anaerobic ribonucleoside-triphosphate reductase activating protein [Lachnospiraceae bacterium]|nr:anaerobic ribonucleoside-triphosphate reductase activating protein [Lachnospiraceae bacterium]